MIRKVSSRNTSIQQKDDHQRSRSLEPVCNNTIAFPYYFPNIYCMLPAPSSNSSILWTPSLIYHLCDSESLSTRKDSSSTSIREITEPLLYYPLFAISNGKAIPLVHPLIELPFVINDAFHTTDFQRLADIMQTHCSANCTFYSTAMNQVLYGYQYIVRFFQSLFQAHPDAIIELQEDPKLYEVHHSASSSLGLPIPSMDDSPNPTSLQLQCPRVIHYKLMFIGTRLLPSSPRRYDLSSHTRTPSIPMKIHHLDDEFMFKAKNKYCCDYMNTSQTSEADIIYYRALEDACDHIEIVQEFSIFMHLKEKQDISSSTNNTNFTNFYGDVIDYVHIDMQVTTITKCSEKIFMNIDSEDEM